MLRGAKKNMIVVRTRDSRMFEEAYFVMRRDPGLTTVDESDMLWEANRILEAAMPRAGRELSGRDPVQRGGRLRGLLWFGLGLISGGGITGLFWLIL